jgi:hypothetical protein
MKRKRASSIALKCCCDDIRAFGQWNQDQNRAAHKARRLLYRNQSRTWTISSEELEGSSRAWSFQERALSTRIVHFTKEELVWECKQKRQCECDGINGASFITSLVGSIRRRSKLSDSDDDDDDDDDSVSSSVNTDQYEAPESAVGLGIDNFKSTCSIYSEPERIWWTFVEYYTTRKLTEPEDRGAAFSGIAKIFGGIMREWDEEVGEYCAGYGNTIYRNPYSGPA